MWYITPPLPHTHPHSQSAIQSCPAWSSGNPGHWWISSWGRGAVCCSPLQPQHATPLPARTGSPLHTKGTLPWTLLPVLVLQDQPKEDDESNKFFPPSFGLAFSIQWSLCSYTHVQLLQYLSEECGPCSLSEFKAFLENRGRIRTQLIEDLRKKRMPHCLHYFHTWERGQAYLLCTMREECNYIMTMIGLAVLTYGLDWIGGEWQLDHHMHTYMYFPYTSPPPTTTTPPHTHTPYIQRYHSGCSYWPRTRSWGSWGRPWAPWKLKSPPEIRQWRRCNSSKISSPLRTSRWGRNNSPFICWTTKASHFCLHAIFG